MSLRSLLLALGFAVLSFTAWADPLAVGTAAPKVKASDQDGKQVNLGALFAKGTTLIYFYPKANTSECTTEARRLRDAFSSFTHKEVRIIGVSLDKPEEQKKFQTKYHLPFTLIADSDRAVSNAFGVPIFMGMDERQSFLVKNGVIVWSNLRVNPSRQPDEVLREVASR